MAYQRFLRTKCMEHGWIQGEACVACAAIRYKQRVELGLIDEVILIHGSGPRDFDPLPNDIRDRAAEIRRQRDKETWDSSVRVVRMFHDPEG